MNDSNLSKIERLNTVDISSGANNDMESEIEFGKVELAQPKVGLRPDQDKHFAVTVCGDVDENDLPIFVDMDVLRDMEAHARENTRVELGGVMLGRQHIDQAGNPFVIITDSLRAKHYEATKGSFKFTHETWSQITRERNEFKGDLELVGWYHTHPGWGVFLSGMDLFICNNFFSRPLDVALVIDPCAGDRGWFQWSEDGTTRQTPGFFLMTNRHRQAELNYFSEIFSNQNPTIHDPRFRQASFGDQGFQQGESMVNVIDNRRPVFELAIVSMLFLQLIFVALFGYRFLGTSEAQPSTELDSRIAAVESSLESEKQQYENSIRERAYQSILSQIVDRETGTKGLVAQYTDIATQNQLMSENLEGQLARIKLAESRNSELVYNLDSERGRSKKLQEELLKAQESMVELRKVNDQLAEGGADADNEAANELFPAWLIYIVGGTSLFFLGVLGGTWFTRRQLDSYDDDYREYEGQKKQVETVEKPSKQPGESEQKVG